MEKQINGITLSLNLQMLLKTIISNHKEEEFKDVSCNAEAKSPPVCYVLVLSTSLFAFLMREGQIVFTDCTHLSLRTISFSGMNRHICALG